MALSIWEKVTKLDSMITSGTDGQHMNGSLHYEGLAVDIRTLSATPEMRLAAFNSIKLALGENFDVILEKDHIHIEYDPKPHTGVPTT